MMLACLGSKAQLGRQGEQEVMRHGDRGMGGTSGGTQHQEGPFNFEQHRPGPRMVSFGHRGPERATQKQQQQEKAPAGGFKL